MTITTSAPKRFIAGAICMGCGRMDTTALYTENGRQVAECVECHYRLVEPTPPNLYNQ